MLLFPFHLSFFAFSVYIFLPRLALLSYVFFFHLCFSSPFVFRSSLFFFIYFSLFSPSFQTYQSPFPRSSLAVSFSSYPRLFMSFFLPNLANSSSLLFFFYFIHMSHFSLPPLLPLLPFLLLITIIFILISSFLLYRVGERSLILYGTSLLPARGGRCIPYSLSFLRRILFFPQEVCISFIFFGLFPLCLPAVAPSPPSLFHKESVCCIFPRTLPVFSYKQ